MKRYRLEAEAAVTLDVEAAFEWYEAEEPNLGFELALHIAEFSRIHLLIKSFGLAFVAP